MNLKHAVLSLVSLSFTLQTAAAPVDPLITASEEAGQIVRNHAEAVSAAAIAGGEQGLIQIERWRNLAAPDAQSLAWLSSRLPGLDLKNVRAVTLEGADMVMQKSVAAKATYLDLLTDPALRKDRGELYYVSQEVLMSLDRKYISGTLPATGTDKKGRPYKMQGIVAGAGSIIFLYDQTDEFIFKNNDVDIKIAPGGKVVSTINGPADSATTGVSGCMRVGFYFCAEVQRTTKASDGKITVQTSRGPQTQDINPIRAR